MAESKLQLELKKKKPFASRAQEAVLNLARTSDRIQLRFERLFREYGITASQYNVLRILRGEGAPLPVLEIASRTVTVVPGITGLVDRLLKAAFVTRRRCEDDRRVVYVEITAQGLAVLGRLDEPLEKLHEALLSHVTDTDLNELIRLLEKAREGLAQPEP